VSSIRALNQLGLTICPPTDLIGAHPTNPAVLLTWVSVRYL
jgi:hypothetical protein